MEAPSCKCRSCILTRETNQLCGVIPRRTLPEYRIHRLQESGPYVPVDAIRAWRRGFWPGQTQRRLARSWPNDVVGWKECVILFTLWRLPVYKHVQKRIVPNLPESECQSQIRIARN